MKITKSISRITAVLLLCFFAFALVSCDTGTFQGKEAIPLSAPVNLKVSDSTLTWNPVENAIGYTVKIQQGKNASADAIGDEIMVSTNNYSLEALREGDYTISVKSRGDTVLYSSSNYSSSIQYTRKSDSGLEYEDVVSGAFGSFDEINTRESYLGYGIDIINATGVTSKNIKTTYPIFSKDAILNETLLKSNEHYSVYSTVSGFSIEEFKAKLAVSSSISAGASLSASVKISELEASESSSLSGGYIGAFEQTSSETHTQYFLEIMAENQNYWLMLQTQESRYKEILSEEFKKDLYDPTVTPAQLFDKYGTHLLTSVAMGGNINMFYTLYSTQEGVTNEQYFEIATKLQSSASVSMQAGNEGISAGNSYEILTSNSAAIEEMKNNYGVNIKEDILISGGKGDFGITTVESLLGNYAAWQKSLDAYPVVVGLKDSNSLYPIWNLIDTSVEGGAERHQELYSYFSTYGQRAYNELCQTYGIVEPVAPTEITNIQIKTNSDYQEGDLVQIKAGDTFQIKFDVLPDTANKYKKTFSVDSEYVTIDGSGNVSVSPDIPNSLPVVFTLTAGAVERTITCQVVMTCNIIFNTVVPGLTVDPIIGIESATTIQEPRLHREGYTLDGWYKDQEYTQKFDFDTNLVTSSMVLYAKWTPIKPVIMFNSNGGSEIDSQTIAYNGTVEQPNEPTMDGYSFVGWYNDKELTEEFDFTTNIKSNITLYAKWDKIIFTVTFETNGGTHVASRTTNVDELYEIDLPTTQKTDFIFMGWFRDYNFLHEFLSSDKVTENLTLYAKWEAVKPIIEFDSTGGSLVDSQTIAYGGSVDEPIVPTQDGYKFIGWYKDKDLTEKFDFSTPVYKKLKLYAKWEKLIFTIKFDSMGGTPVSDKMTSIDSDYLISEPSPIRTHYTLDGWYTSEEYTVKFYFDQEITSNITLYAKWTINNINVQFVDEDGHSPLVAADGEKLSTKSTNYLKEFKLDNVPTPYKEGYVFLGWKMGGKEIDVTTYEFSNEKANYKLTALWIDEEHAYPVKITINYLYKDGTVAARPYVDESKYYEETFEINSPVIMGYAPDQYVVSGVVPVDELVINVYYKEAPFNVILNYVMSDGTQAPEKTITPIDFNSNYSIKPIEINGYTPDIAVVTGTMGAEDKEYTITYTPNNYTVTIIYKMTNDENAPETEIHTVPFNSEYKFIIKDIAGYTASESYISGIMGDKNITQIVTYSPNKYTVTIKYIFSDNNNTVIEPTVETFDHLQPYNIHISNVKGYHPETTTVSGTINAQDVEVTVTYKPNLYNVTISYVFSDGSNATIEQTTEQYFHLASYNIEISDIEGYHSETPNVSGTIDAEDVEVTVTYHPNTYTVHFHRNNGSGETITQSFVYNAKKNLTQNTYTRSGYTFAGWNEHANGTGKSYANGESVSNLSAINGDTVHLYAQWDGITYTIYLNGEATNAYYTTKEQDQWISLPTPSKSYHKFITWVLNGEGYAVSLSDSTTLYVPANVYGDVYMYAEWVRTSYIYWDDTIHTVQQGNGYSVDVPGVFDVAKLQSLGYSQFYFYIHVNMYGENNVYQYVDFYFNSGKLTFQYDIGTGKWVDESVEFARSFSEVASNGSFKLGFGAWDNDIWTNEIWKLGIIELHMVAI